MGELGDNTGSSYPTSIDQDTIKEVASPNAGKTKITAARANDVGAAIVSTQAEVGIRGAATQNIRDTINTEHLASGLHGNITTQSHTTTGTEKLAKGADVASAAALTVGTDGNYFDVTGTTTITSIATVGVGTVIRLHFDAALTLTHNAVSLALPNGNNITTNAGDEYTFIEESTGNWRMVAGSVVPLGRMQRTEVTNDNTGSVTLLFTDVTITTINLGTVNAGDRILLSAWVRSTKGTLGGGRTTIAIRYDSGTSTVRFAHDLTSGVTHQHDVAANSSTDHSLFTIARVTVGGTLVIKLDGNSEGDDSTVGIGLGQLHGIVLNNG